MIIFTTPQARPAEGCAELKKYEIDVVNESAVLEFRIGYMTGNTFTVTQERKRVFVSNLDPGADLLYSALKAVPMTNIKDFGEVQKAIETKMVELGIFPTGTVSLAGMQPV